MLNDHGVRLLAAAILLQAIADLDGPSESDRQSAAAFIARDDFDHWCVLAGLEGEAVRERRSGQISHHEEAA